MSDYMPLGQDALLRYAQAGLEAPDADQVQVSISASNSSLTRFAGSVIHQNVSERNFDIGIKVAVGKRLGFAGTNILNEQSLRETAELAVQTARRQPENREFVSLPEPSGDYPDVSMFHEKTARFSPEDRAEAVRVIVDRCAKEDGAGASGSLSTGAGETCVVNSLGISAYGESTWASLVVVAEGQSGGVSYAERHSRDVAEIDAEAAAAEAAERCARNSSPADVEPGEYEVVLNGYATVDLVSVLGWCGLGALSLQEGRSFMSGRIGQQIMSENISLVDDGADKRGWIRKFDGEGYPKRRVELISGGTAKGVVYDSYTAFREGRESTGHGIGGIGTLGPMPTNLVMEPGETSVDEMIAAVKRGLFVTRFHYTNVLKESDAVVTGMTRDGTFLIEDGRVVGPVKNLRFTESILRAFSGTLHVGRELERSPMVLAPALHLKSFRFTSATDF